MTNAATPILSHDWGASNAADRVWSLVSGIAPNRSGGRLFLVLQAYIDDSGDDDVFALAGFISSAKSWATFSKEWENALGWGVIGNSGAKRFKMSEMAYLNERMERVPAFFDIISSHVLCALSFVYKKEDLSRAKQRIRRSDGRPINWGFMDNYYMIAFKHLMDLFHNGREDDLKGIIPSGEKIDFIFDEQSEKRQVLAGWDEYMNTRPAEIRGLYGSYPKFENDEEFLPLQAADLWAWWIRKWYSESADPDDSVLDFGRIKIRGAKFPRLRLSADEDHLANNLVGILREAHRDCAVIDIKNFSPSGSF
ncbi:DUF3800 domain-containing protein [Ciceribacter sp. L1K23]|uniref:DUF3800 domain-containing protein n=1 Tax=Ciceribacter sp. L1K23 TaxID=2820276 RepID=UPI001B82A247|nr:DUF3800 domain-containing protein [Ciceribacter sp. L1K23]MBR0558430.1 DUF3800 domain-containing protein [Ciceribacter sp. L1K23]